MGLTEQEKAKRRAERFAKPVAQQYGLLSRGDDSLKDKTTRSEYYREIREAYRKYCIENDEQEGLKLVHDASTASTKSTQSIDQILLSLRKLREALIATHSGDKHSNNQNPTEEHQQVYIFSIKVAILAGHSNSYAPTIAHLLHDGGSIITSTSDFKSIAKWHCLHIVHFNDEISNAYEYNWRHNLDLERVLRAWSTGNWVGWNSAISSLDVYSRSIVETAGARGKMLQIALQRIGKSYVSMGVESLERYVGGYDWGVLESKCSWVREGERVVIRKSKAKPHSS